MPMSVADAAHLMRRAGFGASAATARDLSRLSRSELVDQLLDTSTFVAPAMPPFVTDDTVSQWEKCELLRGWWLNRLITGAHPLVEKMTLFWHGHFTAAVSKVYDTDYLWRMHDAQRQMGLGNVRLLAQNMAIQPAMLWYLDNDDNVAANPNQNFARELLELFLLGVGNYSEGDVVAAARAWTGHHLDETNRRYVFKPRVHETRPSTFMGTTQVWDGPQLIDFLFDHPVHRQLIANHLAARLWSFFAHPFGKPAAALAAVASALLNSGFELKPALRVLFLRDEFWLPVTREGLVRTPIEYVVHVFRCFGINATEVQPTWFLHSMGHSPFNPPNVSGWRPNGYWLSAASATMRSDYAGYLYWKLEQLARPSYIGLATMTIPDAVSFIFERLGIIEPSANSRAVLTAWFERQRATRYQGWAETPMAFKLSLLLPELQIA